MSIGGDLGAPAGDAWNDMEVVRAEIQHEVFAADLDGTFNQTFGGNGVDYPAGEGGLERGEMAELVAIMFWTDAWYPRIGSDIAATAHSEPVVFFGEFEGSVNSSLEPATLATRTNNNLNTSPIIAEGSSSFFRGRSVHYPPFADPATGEGGGGASNSTLEGTFINYRRQFGMGPVFDWNDELHWDGNIFSHGADTAGVQHKLIVDHYFDVWQAEDIDFHSSG